jgi:hypothetical protein
MKDIVSNSEYLLTPNPNKIWGTYNFGDGDLYGNYGDGMGGGNSLLYAHDSIDHEESLGNGYMCKYGNFHNGNGISRIK